MVRAWLLGTAAWASAASGAFAQSAQGPQAQANESGQPAAASAEQLDTPIGEVVVTATRRAQRLADVPLAVSVVTTESLTNSGAADIRQLTQLSPSLLVSSTSSEAGAGVARIRGVGTVGDNPGLESSVGTFIDGVYRNRSGVALSELGAIERIEVLRGPQGTLFGRNVSAGLINIVTAQPKFENDGYAAFTVQNYSGYRVEGGFTGPIGGGDKLAGRFDGVYFMRDGFVRDVYTNKKYNDRQRYLLRGQLLWKPTSDFSFRLIGDFAKRNEQCCAAVYAPLTAATRAAGTPAGQIGTVTFGPAPYATLLQSLRDANGNPVYIGGTINNQTNAASPGRNFQSDVQDWGISGEANWNLGAVKLTSITAYRNWSYLRGQDADYNNLDVLYRENYKQTFETFSQELRLQGELFKGKLNWLVGGYFANEDLFLRDRLRFGSQFGQVATLTVRANPALASFPGYDNLRLFAQGALAAGGVPAPVIGIFAPLVPNLNLNNVGQTADNFKQNSRNFAFFTHNQINITDRLQLTLGLRYTNERKRLTTDLNSDNTACAAIRSSIANVQAVGAGNPALAPVAASLAGNLSALAGIPCIVNNNTLFDLKLSDVRPEEQLTGTAVLSWKPVDQLLTYASYSKGYKAGGFNFDRSALRTAGPSVNDLRFRRETADAYEIGAKYASRRLTLTAALFRQEFSDFQLNLFNGLNFIVENVNGCSQLGTPAAGQVRAPCTGKLEPGVISQGVELEAFTSPVRNVTLNLGYTYADTRYAKNAVGLGGRALANPFFLLPDSRLSNAPESVFTGAVTWTPPIGSDGYSALFYVDGRYSSGYNTGSDLEPAKYQRAFGLVNARVGLRGPKQAWSVELWAQNLFDQRYTQVAFDAPFQPIGSTRPSQVTNLPAGAPFSATQSNALYARFPGEPRQWGLTVRTKF
ncbi:MAG: TonB-dependent receptor [Sphingomonadaceae bacterium]|nr:TonB-dependent receptor [Sphingomonadaceae bacterium]